MRDQRICDAPERGPSSDLAVVLDLLVESHPMLWTVSELARAVCSTREARTGDQPAETSVEDALQELYGAGLVHRAGGFAFASRAAVAGARLRM